MKVLVAYDGSKPSKKALDSVAEFAAKYGADQAAPESFQVRSETFRKRIVDRIAG